MDQPTRSFAAIIKHPCAIVPLAMSILALTLVLGLAPFDAASATDEGTAAHLWQILMVGQLPILVFFAFKWLPRAPRQSLYVLALQAVAVLAAVAPVLYFKL
jgi:hypothetical protein